MKCEDVQRECWEMEDGKVSSAARDHIGSCKDCRLVFERVQTLCHLVALKAHETPDKGFDARMTASVLRGIREAGAKSPGFLAFIREWLESSPVPAVRYAAVAALVAVVGAGSFAVFQQEQGSAPAAPVVAAQPEPAAPAATEQAVAEVAVELPPSAPLVASSPFQLVNPNLPVVFVASNRNPMFEQTGYGGVQAVPVSFQLDR